jgi:hypothetical protein
VGVILAGILAVALWFGANDPRIVIHASGGPNITTDPDPAVIAAGVLVLGEGKLFGLVSWAIGTIGSHVVELHKQVTPLQKNDQSHTKRQRCGLVPDQVRSCFRFKQTAD